MKSSYLEKDVTILLKDITGFLSPMDAWEREKQIQNGAHYSELLPVEYSPTSDYIALYQSALKSNASTTAEAVMCLAEQIVVEKGRHIVLVSLARAGTPIGILLKRYLEKKYGQFVPHYTISIIRGRGFDKNAMAAILASHKPSEIQFIDGWIGKGAIAEELKKETKQYVGISPELAVLADPAGITRLAGSREDFLIPSSCLNATVSGLFSRTVFNKSIIKEKEFHGAVYYQELEKFDVSYAFIDAVEKEFDFNKATFFREQSRLGGLDEIEKIKQEFQIADKNRIKPGIGETTRVLMRRVPWKVLIKDKKDLKNIGHILRLSEEKQIEVIEYPLIHYRACGIIKDMHADI